MTKRVSNNNRNINNKNEESSNIDVLNNNFKNNKKNKLSLFRLPSVKLCLLNSLPITSFYSSTCSNLLDLSKNDDNDRNLDSSTVTSTTNSTNGFSNIGSNTNKRHNNHSNKLNNKNRNNSRIDTSNTRFNNNKVDKKKVEKLKNELYAMNILNRLIKLGINNKLNILSLYKFNSNNISSIISPEKNDQQGLLQGNESNINSNNNNNNLINLFIKSMLNREQQKLINSSNNDLLLNEKDGSNKLNFNNSIFSIMDFCLPGFVFNNSRDHQQLLKQQENNNTKDARDVTTNPATAAISSNTNIKQKLTQQEKEELQDNMERKIKNLLDNKLCNGNEINFNKFILSILLVNRFDFLPPHFINLLLSYFIKNFDNFSNIFNNIL